MKTALLAVAMTSLLSGCVTPPYEGQYAFGDGWRKAQVTAVLQGSELDRPNFYRCARKLSPDQVAAGRFVLLSYLEMGRSKRTLVSATGNEQHPAGARVLVNLERCDAPLITRHD
ncbi:MAG: hypothetical protein HYX47_12560 [Burkholderiales bacterium]|nr:hypothetical protein [Burkholderiales bacterium]